MKESIKAKTIFTFFSGIIFIAVFSGCADIDHKPVETGISIKGKKEILVARDVARGGTFYEIKWCGNNALLFKGTDIGIVLIDIEGGKRVTITGPSDYDWPLNCTPDGRWVVYVHGVSIPNPDYEEHAKPGESTFYPRVMLDEVYRYEVATGRREKFAVTISEGSSSDWVSPDGKKISLVPWRQSLADLKGIYQSIRGAPEPWLEEVWFGKRWGVVAHAWFPDSSGMAALLSYPSGVGVEFFGEDGWAKAFDLRWPWGLGISSLKTDRENRIYFKTSMDTIPDPDMNTVLHRCTIEGRELACENILERDELGPYEILPGGDILFDYDGCIRRTTPGGTDSECVIGKRYGSRIYRGVGLIGLSPDGRWLAFERDSYVSTPSELYSDYQADLFVVELNKD